MLKGCLHSRSRSPFAMRIRSRYTSGGRPVTARKPWRNAQIVDTQRRPMSDWVKMKCYNSVRVRFIAGKEPVTLEISDPVRNVGPRTLLIDGISVTPYYRGNAVE